MTATSLTQIFNNASSLQAAGGTHRQYTLHIGDFNLDCIVNFLDFAVFADHWLECTRPICP